MTSNELQIAERVPLAPLTTIGIGGAARFFVRVRNVEQLLQSVLWAKETALPIFILGGGSNLLIADRGFDGLVIQIDLAGVEIRETRAATMVRAGAGEPWDRVVERCVVAGLSGIECLSGIPGNVGATPIQNVGAYGQEVSETIVEVEVLDRQTLERRSFANEECHFGYRRSRFKNEEPDRFIVLGVTYALRRGGDPSIRYPELRRYLDEQGLAAPSLADTREAVLAVRRRKGMVIDPRDPDTRSDGSFFMNPVIRPVALEEFLDRARGPGAVSADEQIPMFEAEGGTKLSAAWLIEKAGFRKGDRRGQAAISSKHTLAIINLGGATAVEVLDLVKEIQGAVREKFGVELHPEPNFIGF